MFDQSDPRLVPVYSIAEAARYLRIPPATMRSWAYGRPYQTSYGRREFQPLINLPTNSRQLSFTSLIEAHLIEGIRKGYGISVKKIREAQRYLARHHGRREISLVERELLTDGVELYVEEMGRILSASEHGQVVFGEILSRFMSRIELKGRVPLRFFPFTRSKDLDSPKLIAIDPRVAYGRPTIAGTRVGTQIVAERHAAGESIRELSDEYAVSIDAIEEALRCERIAA